MILDRNSPGFWDVRVIERRIRRGEVTRKDYESFLEGLPDVEVKGTESKPLEEPIERPPPRRPAIKITAAPTGLRGKDDLDDDLDDEIPDDDDDDDDDDEDLDE